MSKIRIEKEELDIAPDVLDPTDRVLTWVQRYAKIFLGAAIVVLVVFLGYQTYQTQHERTLTAANDLLTQAIDDYETAINTTSYGSPERAEKLEPVLTKLRAIGQQYADTPVARLALYMEGNVHYNTGDQVGSSAPATSRAIDTFSRYLAVADTPFDKAKGLIGIAYANENAFFLTNQQNYAAEALRFFKQLEDLDGAGFLKYEGMLGRARLLANAGGDIEGAKAIYRKVLDERWTPIAPPEDPENPNQQMMFEVRQVSSLFSLANTARFELARLGVDVEKEYPQTAETKKSS